MFCFHLILSWVKYVVGACNEKLQVVTVLIGAVFPVIQCWYRVITVNGLRTVFSAPGIIGTLSYIHSPSVYRYRCT
jgi:hypothetical protein